ncbi:T9SS type A sorting domain-containing protein [Hymenobacter nivis]|nr:T9SS type A sorting domain-containing protein [Hymenobacter nivis]
MQKILNTHTPMPYSLVQRALLNGKAGLMACLTLLMLAGFTTSVKAGGFATNFVIANGTPYSTNGAPGTFQGRSLGTFDRSGSNLDVLALSAEANIITNPGDNVQTTQLLYRIYRADNLDDVGSFIPLPLQQTSSNGNALKWTNTGAQPNLVSFASTPGTYTLQLYFQTTITNNGITSIVLDANNGDFYAATFIVTVNGSIYQPKAWKSANDGNWFNADNWAPNGIPNSNSDVTIPFRQGTGSGYPAINNAQAQVHNIIIQGTAGQARGRLYLTNSTLFIYGNYQDINAGLKPIKGTLYLFGQDQVIDASTLIDNVVIDGGGTKSLTGALTIQNSITFSGKKGILVTRTENADLYCVILQPTARIVGESEDGYVLGELRSSQLIGEGGSSDFGGIGVGLTANSGNPGTTVATRNSAIYYGAGTSVSIRRSFSFTASVATLQNFNLNFGYLNADLNGIQAANLLLFRSESGDVPFQPLYKTSSSSDAKTLTRNGITGAIAATFTLGDRTNPLPVTLTSFAAVAQGPNALLTWTTAQELNNSGFEVQVSTDGTTFSKLGFVAAVSPNSSAARTYQYRDVTANKQGTRYYRLRQLDVDGKENLFAPQSLSFGGALATSVNGYPNPFVSEINLSLQTAVAGQATVSVLDGVGRQVRSWQPTLAAGASNLVLSDLASLPYGLYVVQVRYNDGQTQRLKVVKQ